MSGIFVSYRRASSAAVVYRLVDELKERFGDEAIFFDVESIEAGASFSQAIQLALSKSTIALIVIGPQWVHVSDDAGNRRLENPDDWVRHEVRAALNSSARVIPLLVEGAEIPPHDLLPPDIKELANLQAFTFAKSPEYWDFDIKRLEERLRKIDRNLPDPSPKPGPTPGPERSDGFSKKVMWGYGLAAVFGIYMFTLPGPDDIQTPDVTAADVAETLYGLVFFFGLAFALHWMGLSDIKRGFTKGKGAAIGGMVLSALLFVIALADGALLDASGDVDQDFQQTSQDESVQDLQQTGDYQDPGVNAQPPLPQPDPQQGLAGVQKPPFKPQVADEPEDDDNYQFVDDVPDIIGTWSSNINASYEFGNNLNGTVFFNEFNDARIHTGTGNGGFEEGYFVFEYTNTVLQISAIVQMELDPANWNLMHATVYNQITGQVLTLFELYRQ